MKANEKQGEGVRTVPVSLTPDEQWMYDHAGYSYGQGETPEEWHVASAKRYAAAEKWLRTSGLHFSTMPDADADADESWWVGMLHDFDGRLVASVGGCYGDDDYKRVIRAELALEVMPEGYRHE
jgi:hypothetical protein